MVQINEIEPSRFRAGDLITIRGFGFSPAFGANQVAIDGIPEPLFSESDTELVLTVPAGISEDAYVPVFVFRSDTLENDSVQAWASAPVDDLRSGAVRAPGQVPGQTERADPSRVEDVPQGQDYERLATAIEHLLFDVLTTKGDLFAHDGAGLTRFPVGATLDHRLGANPAAAQGLEYVAVARTISLAWAAEKQVADNTLADLIANGGNDQIATVFGLHAAPFTGTVYRLVVMLTAAEPGTTLDQVVLLVNAVIQYDSGTGLGVAIGTAHVVALAVAVTAGDEVQLQAKKAGPAAGDNATLVAHAAVR